MFVNVNPQSLLDLALLDPARHYFICYTLLGDQPYEASWAFFEDEKDRDPELAVFLRKSGLIQIAKAPDLEIERYGWALEQLLSEISWRQANVSQDIAKLIEDMHFQTETGMGAKIAKCEALQLKSPSLDSLQKDAPQIRMMDASDIPNITHLYKSVFSSFAKPNYMIEKLNSGRGRVMGAFHKGQMVSVAQTDFEDAEFALIVGVATYPDHQGRGHGRRLMESLCNVLIQEGKILYLQYDSPVAGALYESMGFQTVEQIIHIKNLAYNR